MQARLFYSREDPYAIRITFHTDLSRPVEWMFARDLLATGTEGRKGLGDVTFWPSAGPRRRCFRRRAEHRAVLAVRQGAL